MKLHLISTILMFLFLCETQAQNADINFLKEINLNRNTSLDGIFRGITKSAAPIAFSIPFVLLAISFIKKNSLLRNNIIYFGASIITSVIIGTVIKYSVNRPRPFITFPYLQNVAEGGSPSFPSGHTMDAFTLATAVSIAYPKWYVIIPSYAWALAVAYSRMDLGVHYPSDVLGGMIIGSGSAYLCYKAQQWLNKRRSIKN